jgi:hypothetical protein
VWLREHRHNFKDGIPEKSKLAQHAYEEGHRVTWDETRVLEIESISQVQALDKSHQPSQSGYIPHLDPSYQ